MSEGYRSGFVSLIGCPNAGKSTLLNRFVGQKVAIVSDRAQTTRNRVLGVLTREGSQIVFLDTPGMTTPKNRLGEYMQKVATEALSDVEAVLFVSDAQQGVRERDERILERLARVSESAAQQSDRGIVPRVGYIPGFVEMLDAAVKYPARLFMYETGPGRAPLKAAIEASLPLTSAAVITGPEGGFTAAEAKMAAAAGFTLCSMGERILRCETAPVLAVSSIMYATGNL